MKSIDSKNILLALCSGVLLGLSQPLFMPLISSLPSTHYWGALALIGYVPLFWAIAEQNLKKTFMLTFLANTVQYTIAFYWIYIALHVYGHIPPLASGLITILVAMLMALLGGFFFVLGRFLSIRCERSFFYYAPFILCALEYCRNYQPFGGFPWGNTGYSIARIPELLQLASLGGIYSLVLLVSLVNAFLCLAIKSKDRKNRFRWLGSALVLVLLVAVYGFVRINRGAHEFSPSLRVALLQGNIPQEQKNQSRLYASDIIDIYRDLYRQAIKEEANLVIWPEASYPWVVNRERPDFKLGLDEYVASVIGSTAYGSNVYHNSAFLIDYHGEVKYRYDKTHLVPFGEYVPKLLIGLVDKIVPGMGAFKPGNEFKPVELALKLGQNLNIGTTICYEGIFPEISRAYANNGANILVNLTNDAWYGASSAPYQHLLMYQVRSVETGRVYLRATNSGVSAWVDVYGQLHKPTGLFERGLVIDNVPVITKSTLYLLIGDLIPILCSVLVALAWLLALRRKNI